jgi:hypothetical protein
MTIRRYADIDEAALSPAEKTLLENCKAGVPTVLEDGEVPDGPSDARNVRADLLRYLICGRCEAWPVADRGVDLTGAYVTGTLDLNFATAKGATGLVACRFENRIEALQARFEFLNLNRSHLPGLMAQGAQVTGSVFLREVTAEGEVRLSGAGIGGQLDCEGARFGNAGGDALDAQSMEVTALLWRGVAAVSGAVDLNGAKVADLVDDAASWDLVELLYLNGFRYDSIHGPMTARMRLGWVAKDAKAAGEFRPQPYEQLASVFRAMGHTSDARLVLLEKEIRLAADWTRRAVKEQADLRKRRDATPMPADHHEVQNRLARLWLDLRILPVWHWFLRYLVGYGHAPQRVLYWTAGTITVMGLFYLCVWNFGGMVPNSDIILTSPHWAEAMAANPGLPGVAWEASEVGQHYQTFAAATYAADVFIPLVDLGQEAAWTATTATRLGGLAWVATWFLKLFGWIVTAVGAAAITGIIRRE